MDINDEIRIRMLEALMLLEMMDGDTIGIHDHGFSDSDLSWGAHALIQSIVNGECVPESTANMLEKIHDCGEAWIQ